MDRFKPQSHLDGGSLLPSGRAPAHPLTVRCKPAASAGRWELSRRRRCFVEYVPVLLETAFSERAFIPVFPRPPSILSSFSPVYLTMNLLKFSLSRPGRHLMLHYGWLSKAWIFQHDTATCGAGHERQTFRLFGAIVFSYLMPRLISLYKELCVNVAQQRTPAIRLPRAKSTCLAPINPGKAVPYNDIWLNRSGDQL